MSLLVAFRGRPPNFEPDIEWTPLRELRLRMAYDEAFKAWGVNEIDLWSAATGWRRRTWDDLVNEAIVDPVARTQLVGVLVSLAQQSDELALWYAGFPEGLATVGTPDEFGATLSTQLELGQIEPSIRLVVDPPFAGARHGA